jgi:hypothetical protein
MFLEPAIPSEADHVDFLPAFAGDQALADLSAIAFTLVGDNSRASLLPNVHEWRLGDLVLRSPESYQTSPVFLFQSKVLNFDESIARYTHVGIYDGAGHVWHNMPGDNIRKETVSTYLGTARRFCVFRPVYEAFSLHRFESTCRHLRDHTRYSYAQFVESQNLKKFRDLIRKRPFFGKHDDSLPQQLSCANFAEQVLRICSDDAFHLEEHYPVPAHFSVSKRCRKRSVHWCRL